MFAMSEFPSCNFDRFLTTLLRLRIDCETEKASRKLWKIGLLFLVERHGFCERARLKHGRIARLDLRITPKDLPRRAVPLEKYS